MSIRTLDPLTWGINWKNNEEVLFIQLVYLIRHIHDGRMLLLEAFREYIMLQHRFCGAFSFSFSIDKRKFQGQVWTMGLYVNFFGIYGKHALNIGSNEGSREKFDSSRKTALFQVSSNLFLIKTVAVLSGNFCVSNSKLAGLSLPGRNLKSYPNNNWIRIILISTSANHLPGQACLPYPHDMLVRFAAVYCCCPAETGLDCRSLWKR